MIGNIHATQHPENDMRIELSGVDKTYTSGKIDFQALKNANLTIETGELTAIIGPSGSGKSTLMNMITGIDRPTRGTVTIGGRRIDTMTENQLAGWRANNVGIIFQFFQLLPTLTAGENVILAMEFAGRGKAKDRKRWARENLEMVGLGDKYDNLPSELSGGEQQRVAIARALANDPQIIIGDEPTGNLDSKTEEKMFALLKELNDNGKTVLYVTHSQSLAARANRRIEIRDGVVVSS